MKISNSGLDLIKSFEGLGDGNKSTPGLDPYLCPAGVATIGWGHVILQHGQRLEGKAGLHVAIRLYPKGITVEEAERLLRQDCERFENAVDRLVKVPITQNQFDALVSFAFNLGEENLRRSTLLKRLNAGEYREAAIEFPKWNKANGQVLPGLVRRRKAEAELFLKV